MARGGKREGAGRKTGHKTQKGLERDRVLAALRQRIMGVSDILFDSQLTIARGLNYLFKIEKEKMVGPKGGISYKPKKPELVTSVSEIEMYLTGLCEESELNDENDPAATYYYLTTKDPDNDAIDSMFDRALGKAKQGEMDINVRTVKPILGNIVERMKNDKKK